MITFYWIGVLVCLVIALKFVYEHDELSVETLGCKLFVTFMAICFCLFSWLLILAVAVGSFCAMSGDPDGDMNGS